MWYITKINGNVIHLACFGREIIYIGFIREDRQKNVLGLRHFQCHFVFNGDRHISMKWFFLWKKGEDIDIFHDNSKMRNNDLHIHIYNIIL